MNRYIATFGAGQENEGYYLLLHADNYLSADRYMKDTYASGYCKVYGEEDWNSWSKEADEIGFPVEKLLREVVVPSWRSSMDVEKIALENDCSVEEVIEIIESYNESLRLMEELGYPIQGEITEVDISKAVWVKKIKRKYSARND